MSLVLEKYLVVKSPVQAITLQHLVGDNLDYVKEFFPGVAARYANYPKAVKNIARQAVQEAFHPFIIRPGRMKAACGIATIIRNSLIEHPDGTVIQGHNLHYWLDGQHEGMQNDAAETLVRESRKLAWEYNRAPVALGPERWSVTKEDASHVYFAALPAEGYNPASGLANIMASVGQPAVLSLRALGNTIIEPTDTVEQLYYNSELLSHRP